MAEEDIQTALTPDEELAATITESIGAANLVSVQKLPRIKEGLIRGNLTSSDWKLFAELGPTSKEGTDAK
jgi:hypothetical protein